MAGTTRPRVVAINGQHWLVVGDTGHQITGETQLHWAQILYGPAEQATTMDWEPGPILFDIIPAREIEKIARGEVADPFGWWLVQTSEPGIPVTPEEASWIGGDPEAPVDTTTDDDPISIQLPQVRPLPPPDPTGVVGPQPDLAQQIQGAEADRTPGLALPEIPVYVSPTQPVPDTEQEPTPPSGAGGEGPYNRPGAGAATTNGPYSRPGASAPVHDGTSYDRPGANSPVQQDRYDRPGASAHVNQGVSRDRPGATSPVRTNQPYNRPSGAATYASALPPPTFPLLRSFLNRRGQPTAWLDRIEGR